MATYTNIYADTQSSLLLDQDDPESGLFLSPDNSEFESLNFISTLGHFLDDDTAVTSAEYQSRRSSQNLDLGG